MMSKHILSSSFTQVIRRKGLFVVCLLLLHFPAGSQPPDAIAKADNPKPDVLPTLWVHKSADNLLLVASRFPNAPGFTCDSWCYESEVDFLDAKALDAGRMELRHRDKGNPRVVYVTTVTPEPGAVEFSVRAVLDPGQSQDTKLPDSLQGLNLCWQLRDAPGFASKPEPYPEFIKRCFLFTDAGRTLLHNTNRRLIPCRKPDDPYNNPPWVQTYVGVWSAIPEVQPTSWADISTDRFTIPIIGAVSRDGKYLAAIANGSSATMCQAWHDCMHNNPPWLPADAPPSERTWRVKIHVMENNPEALIARVVKDFPGADKLKDKRVPPK